MRQQGGDRMSEMEAVLALISGEESTWLTGILINYELHQLGHKVVKST